jgi:hypothetical protein
MSAPTLDDFPALGFIPCPGDLEAAEAIQGAFSDTAGRLEEVCAVLTGADEGEWRGQTAIAFREVLDDELRPKIEEAHQSFSDAARALADWVDRMRDDQQTADDLEEDAAAALAELETAQSVVDGLPPDTREEDPPEGETDEERQQREDDEEARDGAEQDVRIADAALQEFRDRAALLQQEYNDYGQDVAERLGDAMDIAPNEPGFFGSIAEGISGIVDGLSDLMADLGDWVIAKLGELAPILSVFNNIMGVVLTVLSIAAIFFPVLAPAVLVIASVVLLTTYAQKVGETGSFTEALKSPSVWAAAAGVVLGGAGVAIARSTSPAMNAVSSLGGGSLRTGGFAMAPAGAYPSISNAVRLHNTVTGSTYAVEAFNSVFNAEGNHLNNITGFGLGSMGPFSVGDDEFGGPSMDESYDNYHHSDQERQAGEYGTNPDDYAIGQPT